MKEFILHYNSFGARVVQDDDRYFPVKTDGTVVEFTMDQIKEYYNDYKQVNIIHRPSIVFIFMDILKKNGSQYLKTEKAKLTAEQLKDRGIQVEPQIN